MNCIRCGESFEKKYPRSWYCSSACAKEAHREKVLERYHRNYVPKKRKPRYASDTLSHHARTVTIRDPKVAVPYQITTTEWNARKIEYLALGCKAFNGESESIT